MTARYRKADRGVSRTQPDHQVMLSRGKRVGLRKPQADLRDHQGRVREERVAMDVVLRELSRLRFREHGDARQRVAQVEGLTPDQEAHVPPSQGLVVAPATGIYAERAARSPRCPRLKPAGKLAGLSR